MRKSGGFCIAVLHSKFWGLVCSRLIYALSRDNNCCVSRHHKSQCPSLSFNRHQSMFYTLYIIQAFIDSRDRTFRYFSLQQMQNYKSCYRLRDFEPPSRIGLQLSPDAGRVTVILPKNIHLHSPGGTVTAFLLRRG